MILDKEEHRNALIQLFKSSTFSGEQVEFVHELYCAIKSAVVCNRGERQSQGDDESRSEIF